MMRIISDYELEMSEKANEWITCDLDGNCTLREDAPKDVKDFWEYMERVYKEIPSCFL